MVLTDNIEIVRALADNGHAIEDYKYAREAAKTLEAENFGENDQWDHTKPSFKNFTFKDYQNSMNPESGTIAKMLKD